jgi:hypothetical protein
MTTEKMNKDKFEDVIKKKLRNYSLPVEDDSWREIEKRLEASPRKKALWPWISGVAVAASILLIWLIFPFNKQIIYHETAVQLPDYEETITESVSEGENPLLVESPSVPVKPVYRRQSPQERSEKIPVFPDFDVTEVEEKLPEVEKEPLIAENSGEKEMKQEEKTVKNFSLWEEDDLSGLPRKLSAYKKKEKSLGLHAGSGSKLLAMNSNFNSSGAFSSDLRTGFISQNAPSGLESEMLTPDDFTQITHYPPLSFGLTLRKELSNHLSVESGLVYSYLRSKFKNKFPVQDAKLELHYLGIPVNLVANLFSGKYSKWNVYVSAGGMGEKGLLSHYVQNKYDGNLAITTFSDEKIDGMQWSVNAAIGIDYKVIKNYSIYLEPKMTYYLDNNQPYNARIEHPWMFGVNAGLRYTW